MLNIYRYSRWDGTQEVSPFNPDEVLENLADDLLADGDVRNALQRILQRGFQHQTGNRTMGLQQMMERLRQQRQQQLDRYDLGSMVDQIKEKLDEVLELERAGIQRRLDEAKERFEREQDASTGQQQNGEPQPGEEQGENQPGQRGQDQPTAGGQRTPSSTGNAEQSGAPQRGQQPSGGSPTPSPLDMLQNIANRKLNQLDS